MNRMVTIDAEVDDEILYLADPNSVKDIVIHVVNLYEDGKWVNTIYKRTRDMAREVGDAFLEEGMDGLYN
jgi:hypothetical protein